MKKLTVTGLDVFSFLGRLVRAWPASYAEEGPELRHKRINTFAVIEEAEQLESSSMTKDPRHQDKDYFFSRHWEDQNFTGNELAKELPALLVWEESGTLQTLSGGTEKLLIRAVIQDQYVERFEPGAMEIGRQRTHEQIKVDIRALRDTLLAAIDQAVFVHVPGESAGKFYPKGWLEGQGLSTSGQRLSNFIQFQGVETTTISLQADGGLVETFFSFTIMRTDCGTVASFADFNFDVPKPPELLDHPGAASA